MNRRCASEPIDFRAQISDLINIKAIAVACRIGQSTTAPMTAYVDDIPGLAAATSATRRKSRLI